MAPGAQGFALRLLAATCIAVICTAHGDPDDDASGPVELSEPPVFGRIQRFRLHGLQPLRRGLGDTNAHLSPATAKVSGLVEEIQGLKESERELGEQNGGTADAAKRPDEDRSSASDGDLEESLGKGETTAELKAKIAAMKETEASLSEERAAAAKLLKGGIASGRSADLAAARSMMADVQRKTALATLSHMGYKCKAPAAAQEEKTDKAAGAETSPPASSLVLLQAKPKPVDDTFIRDQISKAFDMTDKATTGLDTMTGSIASVQDNIKSTMGKVQELKWRAVERAKVVTHQAEEKMRNMQAQMKALKQEYALKTSAFTREGLDGAKEYLKQAEIVLSQAKSRLGVIVSEKTNLTESKSKAYDAVQKAQASAASEKSDLAAANDRKSAAVGGAIFDSEMASFRESRLARTEQAVPNLLADVGLKADITSSETVNTTLAELEHREQKDELMDSQNPEDALYRERAVEKMDQTQPHYFAKATGVVIDTSGMDDDENPMETPLPGEEIKQNPEYEHNPLPADPPGREAPALAEVSVKVDEEKLAKTTSNIQVESDMLKVAQSKVKSMQERSELLKEKSAKVETKFKKTSSEVAAAAREVSAAEAELVQVKKDNSVVLRQKFFVGYKHPSPKGLGTNTPKSVNGAASAEAAMGGGAQVSSIKPSSTPMVGESPEEVDIAEAKGESKVEAATDKESMLALVREKLKKAAKSGNHEDYKNAEALLIKMDPSFEPEVAPNPEDSEKRDGVYAGKKLNFAKCSGEEHGKVGGVGKLKCTPREGSCPDTGLGGSVFVLTHAGGTGFCAPYHNAATNATQQEFMFKNGDKDDAQLGNTYMTKVMIVHPDSASKTVGMLAFKRTVCQGEECFDFKSMQCFKCNVDMFKSIVTKENDDQDGMYFLKNCVKPLLSQYNGEIPKKNQCEGANLIKAKRFMLGL